MNVIFSRDGVPKVTFRKAEAETLLRASKLLEMLGRSTKCKEATDASELVVKVCAKFIPVQKELELEEAPN